jgi:hypothetical protein
MVVLKKEIEINGATHGNFHEFVELKNRLIYLGAARP